MMNLLSNLKIAVPEKIFLKDPESSQLGKRIVESSVQLIDEIGFENFTFKKLGAKIGSNESSIYRYFESKHKLLLYLSSWYWAWTEYQLVLSTHNLADKHQKLTKAIEILTRTVEQDSNFSHIDEIALHRIIVNENSKSYLTKEVDEENKDGYFVIYKRLVGRLSEMIVEVNPKYTHSYTLASTIIEGALHQHFLKDHFKTITNCNKEVTPSSFFIDLTTTILKAN